jgi:hypothetical protein
MKVVRLSLTLRPPLPPGKYPWYSFLFGDWGSVVVKALLVGRSPDRYPVVSLGIFSEASDKSMCPGSSKPFEMSTRIFLGVTTAGV